MERTLKETFDRIKENKFLLPDFQREYKWGPSKQQSLLASILLNFPIGGCLILTGRSNNFAARQIGERDQVAISEDYDCEYLLDGQQRTTTLFNAFNDIYDHREIDDEKSLVELIEKKATPLKTRWFLRLPKNEVNKDVTDVFSARELIFDVSELENHEPNGIADVFKSELFDEKRRKGVTKWFSPFFQLKQKLDGMSENKVITQFVNDCSDRGLLPLFHLGSPHGINIIRRILQNIAKDNARALIDEQSEEFDFVKKYDTAASLENYLNRQEVEEDGQDYTNLVEQIFNDAGRDWVTNVITYLTRDIYEGYNLNSLETHDIRRAIPIFCHLNEGGMPLDDFDLVAAKVARKLTPEDSAYSLVNAVRQLFEEPLKLCEQLKHDAGKGLSNFSLRDLDLLNDGLPRGYVSSSILAICTILAKGKTNSYILKEDTSSKTLLNLDVVSIRSSIEKAVVGVARALVFLAIRCGVPNAKKLHYTLMIQPIALVFTDDTIWECPKSLAKIEYWYWCSLFSGKYMYDQSAVVIEDLNSLKEWIKDDSILEKFLGKREEKVMTSDEFSSKELLSCRLDDSPKEAIKTAILQFILSTKPYDLIKGDERMLTAFDLVNSTETSKMLTFTSKESARTISLDDHHIIPISLAKKLGQRVDDIRSDQGYILNSPLNRVYISSDANGKISNLEPSRYFEELSEFDIVLESQLIPLEFKVANTAAPNDLDYFQNLMGKRFERINKKLRGRLLELKQIFK